MKGGERKTAPVNSSLLSARGRPTGEQGREPELPEPCQRGLAPSLIKMAPTPLLFTEKGSSMKTFGTAPLKEPEQEPARSLPNRPNKIINKETLSGFLSCVSCLTLNSI